MSQDADGDVQRTEDRRNPGQSTIVLANSYCRAHQDQATDKERGQWTRERLENAIAANEGPEGLDLAEVNLSDLDLGGMDLHGIVLGQVDEQGNVWGTNLRGAKLQESDLRSANQAGVDLQGARLQRADLQRADLSEANFRGSSLAHAKLDYVQLVPATGLATHKDDSQCVSRQQS